MNIRNFFFTLTSLICSGGVILWILSPLLMPVPSPDEILGAQHRSETFKAKDFQSIIDEQERLQLEPACRRLLEGKPFCKVHHEYLKTDIIKITYGLEDRKPEREEAEANLFPNSNRIVQGGCFPELKRFQCVLYCSQCRHAEIQWGSKPHPSVPFEEVVINETDFLPVTATEAAHNLMKRVEPYYPVLAEQSGIGGVVTLRLYIGRPAK
jgi:hypothetical protein